MDRASQLAIALALAATSAFAFLVLARPMGDEATRLAANVATIAAPLAAAAGGAYAARRAREGRVRLAWTLLGAAMLSWALGQVAWTYYEEIAGREVPFPSIADVGYLGLIPLAVAGLATFPGERTSAALRVRTVVDGLIIASSLLFLSWIFILRPIVATSEPAWVLGVALAYPAGDVILAAGVILIGSRVAGAGRAPWWMLGGGILALAFSDSLFAYLTTIGAYASGGFADIGWFAGFAGIGVAGVMAASAPESAPLIRARASRATMMLPYLPFCVTLIFMAAEAAAGRFGSVLFWTLLLLGLLVILRQMLAFLENIQLAQGLEDAYARLRGSEHARTRLLNTISHDLMNPLTPVQIQLTLLERAPPGLDESQRRSVATIRRNLDVLQRLVGDVKDLARLEGGELPLRLEPIDVREVVETTLATFGPLATERGISLAQRGEESVTVVADRGRITQVMFNLVSNALKFTPSGGVVTLCLETDGAHARLRVCDTGRGLTSEEIGRLFQPFSQVHAPEEATEKGTGLGLFLSRAIAEQHGGRLWVESAGRSRGSTFHLDLPRAG